MSEEISSETQEQEAVTVTPEMLLAQIVAHIGPEFVVIPSNGWMTIVKALHDFDKDGEENVVDVMQGLGVPVIPVSLAGKSEEDESKIILPNDMPQGESKIIMP